MTESPPSGTRWRRRALFVTAGALGAGVVAGGLTLSSTGHQPVVPAAVRLAAVTTAGAAGTDQAAVSYVDSHYPGPGTARALKTEPDVERGVPVCDVRVLAPNGTTYVVHVQQSNDGVLFANPAEQQPVEPVETSEAPATTAPGVSSTDHSTDRSPDRSGASTGGSSPDHPESATSGNDS